jgi:hypothetical protein
VARRRCWDHDWVLDLDIKSFFDEIDWALLMRAVRRHARVEYFDIFSLPGDRAVTSHVARLNSSDAYNVASSGRQ